MLTNNLFIKVHHVSLGFPYPPQQAKWEHHKFPVGHILYSMYPINVTQILMCAPRVSMATNEFPMITFR